MRTSRSHTGPCLVTQSCLTLCDPMDCSPPGSSVHGDSPGKNTGVGCHALLQGIFPAQGSNPGLQHCRQILSCLRHQGSPRILEWVAYPFSRGTSQPRNRTRVSWITGDSLPAEIPLKDLYRLWATWNTISEASMQTLPSQSGFTVSTSQGARLTSELLLKAFILPLGERGIPGSPKTFLDVITHSMGVFMHGAHTQMLTSCLLPPSFTPFFPLSLLSCLWEFEVSNVSLSTDKTDLAFLSSPSPRWNSPCSLGNKGEKAMEGALYYYKGKIYCLHAFIIP